MKEGDPHTFHLVLKRWDELETAVEEEELENAVRRAVQPAGPTATDGRSLLRQIVGNLNPEIILR